MGAPVLTQAVPRYSTQAVRHCAASSHAGPAVQAPVDFTTVEVQQQMDTSLELYSSNEYVTPGTLRSWWVGFKEYKQGAVSPVRPRPPETVFLLPRYSYGMGA